MEKGDKQASVKEKKKDAEQNGCLESGAAAMLVGSTCARSIVSGVYFDGLGGEGALLERVSVGRAVQAAVTHSVQVAAICPKTRRRYREQGRQPCACHVPPCAPLSMWQRQSPPTVPGTKTEVHSIRLKQLIWFPVCGILWA